MLGKKSSEKSDKNVLLYSHKYRYEKMGGEKHAKQFFQKHKNNAIKKCWGKKSSEKSAEKVFLYSHEYREKNGWGKKARINFSRNTRIVRAKNVGEKIFGKK